MEFDDVIEARQSVRNYSSKKVNWRDVVKAIDAATQAPFAGNINTVRFILVSDKEKIQELGDAAAQDFVKKAQFIVAVCSDKSQLQRLYDKRAEMYSRQQAGAAIENFLLKITDLGLASCWIGEFADEIVKRILQVPDNIDVEALLPVGYEVGKAKKRRKAELDTVLYFDKYKNKYMKPIAMPEAD